MEVLEYFFSGGVGGVCTVVTGHPLDTIKVRLQAMPIPKPGETPLYTGTLDCFQKTFRKEGILGFYKGMSAPLLAVTPIFAISFMGFGLGKRIFGSGEGRPITYPQIFAAGCFAGVFTTVVMAPGERVKSLLQIQTTGPKVYDGPIDCIKKLFRQGGIASIYRGTLATLMRDIPGGGTYFLTYEAIKDYLTDGGKQAPSMAQAIFAGGVTGITHWLVAMPPDVLKSRIQTAPEGKYPNGMRDVFKELMVREGPAALYTGLFPVMLRAVPANAACFFGFEMGQRMINYLKYGGISKKSD